MCLLLIMKVLELFSGIGGMHYSLKGNWYISRDIEKNWFLVKLSTFIHEMRIW